MNFRVLLPDLTPTDERLARLTAAVGDVLGLSAEQLASRASARPAWLADLSSRADATRVAESVERHYGLRTSVAPSIGRPFPDLEALVDAIEGSTTTDGIPAPAATPPPPDEVPGPGDPRGWPVCGGPIPTHEAPRVPWPPPPREEVPDDQGPAAETLAFEVDPFEMTAPAGSAAARAAALEEQRSPVTAPHLTDAWRVEDTLAPVDDPADDGLELDWDRGRASPAASTPAPSGTASAGWLPPPSPAELEGPRHEYDPRAWVVWGGVLLALAAVVLVGSPTLIIMLLKMGTS